MSEPASKVRPWDTSLPDYFALDLYENGTIDAAISVTAAQTVNGLGLAHEVVDAARHLLLFNVPAAPLDLPPDFAGTAAQMKNQQRPHDWHAAQERNRPLIRSGFVSGIPERIIRLAEVNGSLRHHAHVHDIIADLRAKLPALEERYRQMVQNRAAQWGKAFDTSDIDALLELLQPERKPDDRSQFVRYARIAAQMAEWDRNGTNKRSTSLSAPSTEEFEYGVARLSDLSCSVEVAPRDKEEPQRILEATQIYFQPILVSSEGEVLGNYQLFAAAKAIQEDLARPGKERASDYCLVAKRLKSEGSEGETSQQLPLLGVNMWSLKDF
jgi:hypothetical protein